AGVAAGREGAHCDQKAERRVARSTVVRRGCSRARAGVKDVAYVALGSNLGQREVFLAQGRRSIGELPKTRVIGESAVEETAPIGPVEQGPFLNQMIAIETELSPQELLEELMRIEQK